MRNMMIPLLLAVVAALIGLYDVEAATGLNPPVRLYRNYYKKKTNCEEAELYVRHQVELYVKGNSTAGVKGDKTIIPKLLRLAYTDCMTNGCDASVLLNGANSEKSALKNRGLGAFTVIDRIKTVLEKRCPGVVSCADIIQLAARDAVHVAGAPSYPIFTGRKDSLTSAKVELPNPSISWDDALKFFQSKGLDVQDMVTLLGAHSMGKTRCGHINDRLYNFNNTGKPDPTMEKSTMNELRKKCPQKRGKKPEGMVYLNPESGANYKFSNTYYRRVLENKAVLGVDQQQRYGDNSTTELVNEFAGDQESFRKAFALSMVRMGSINVLTGTKGEIRKQCGVPNSH